MQNLFCKALHIREDNSSDRTASFAINEDWGIICDAKTRASGNNFLFWDSSIPKHIVRIGPNNTQFLGDVVIDKVGRKLIYRKAGDPTVDYEYSSIK